MPLQSITDAYSDVYTPNKFNLKVPGHNIIQNN